MHQCDQCRGVLTRRSAQSWSGRGRTNRPKQFSRPIEGDVAIPKGMDAPHQRPATPVDDCTEEREGTSGAEGLGHGGGQLCGVQCFVERPIGKILDPSCVGCMADCRS